MEYEYEDDDTHLTEGDILVKSDNDDGISDTLSDRQGKLWSCYLLN